MPYAIEATDLRKSFKNHKAVDGLNLRVEQGELFALLGPNGAGKTTTVNLLSTLLKPDGGTALVAGYDAAKNADEVRRRISATGQFAALDEGLSGLQNVVLMARLQGYSAREARDIAERLVHAFGLAEAKDRAVQHYSGGMRRRLDIAAGIVSRPEVLFLDEPTTGLDPESRLGIWESIRSLLKRGTTVLLTTQYLEEADRLADRVAVMNGGKIVAEGTPSALKASIGGKTLQIRLENPPDLERVKRLLADHLKLAAHPGDDPHGVRIPVTDVGLAGQAIHLLSSHNVALNDFGLGEPSLDEVFLSLTASRRSEEAFA